MLNLTNPPPARVTPQRQRGMSVIELMVGITLGLFVIGGALAMLMSNITGSRVLLLEARINQDLRATADIITRDLKRAGYWGNAVKGVTVSFGATAASVNPYTSITCTSCVNGTTSQVEYGYTKGTENDAIDATERFGYRVSGGAIQMQVSNGSWQPITDTNILNITQFAIIETSTGISVASACNTAPTTNTPTLYVRQYDIQLTGQSTADSKIVRSLESRVRVRNDRLTGACP
jgi:prepilin peptidase dependent protein B